MADNPSRRHTSKTAPVDGVAMRHPDGTGCSWRGQSFAADADGVVTVPIAAAGDLIAHGFSFVGG
ncbi:hypothetical protein [Sphingomonas sp.]|uniref:hypothetical protein n=1 Tax=Sphingomonas sp. TaxID=28214 RepID=UPI0025FAC2B7|nr:hypothetical protein [Sphingomonas sp.]